MDGMLPTHFVGRRRRRWLILVAAVATQIAIPWSLMSLSAAVTNATSVHIVFAGSLSINGPVPIVIPGIHGTADGTVDAAGNISLPKGAISFPPFSAPLAGGAITAQITIKATANWAGTIDPNSGVVNLHAPQTAHLDLSSGLPGDTDCPVGPLDLNLTTGASGTAHGKPYNKATGTAEIVDGTFAIPAIDENPAPPACPDAAAINQLGGLPLAGGLSVADLTTTFTPKNPVPPPPPGAPNAVADAAQTNENTPVTINVLKNDKPDSSKAHLAIDPKSLAITIPPQHGTAKVNTTDDTITYTPNTGFSGQDFFTYELCSQLPVATTTTTPTTTTTTPQIAAVRAAAVAAPCAHATVTVTVIKSSVTATSTVVPTTVAAAAQLPRTGSSSAPIGLLGVGLVAGGLVATGLARSRRRSTAS
jgi:Bacterial Ig domain